ncbi:MAG: hypothetical protein ACJA2D_000162 [Pseudohongiellaceae bacterium]|jgi:hypothetical protein
MPYIKRVGSAAILRLDRSLATRLDDLTGQKTQEYAEG